MTAIDLAARRPVALALLASTRPKQWVKNVLVFAAPVAAGAVTRPQVLVNSLVAFVVFVLASSGCYLVNDVCDAERDRMHPNKRNRPIATGAVSVTTATTAGVVLLMLAVVGSLTIDRELLTVVLLTYVASTISYGAAVKAVPGLEALVLATGFVLRPVAGAAATGVHPSGWFLAVCCLAALTIVLGKRQVELARLGSRAAEHRPALARYTVSGLRRARVAAASGMVAAYGCWAATRPAGHPRLVALLTLAPVVVALARLGRLNDRGEGDAPELVLLADRRMQLAAASWLLLFALGLGRV